MKEWTKDEREEARNRAKYAIEPDDQSGDWAALGGYTKRVLTEFQLEIGEAQKLIDAYADLLPTDDHERFYKRKAWVERNFGPTE